MQGLGNMEYSECPFVQWFLHCAVGKLNINKTVCGTDPATPGLSIKL